MAKKVEIDADQLQYLCETAVAHDVLMTALLALEEQRFPGFAETMRKELDTALGKRPKPESERGWVNVRSRVLHLLPDPERDPSLKRGSPTRRKLRQWLFDWPFERR